MHYNAHLLEEFNHTHDRQCSRRQNHSSAVHPNPGPAQPPPQIQQVHQCVISFQHEAENQRYLQAQQIYEHEHFIRLQQLQQQQQQDLIRQEMEHQQHSEYQQEILREQELYHQRIYEREL